MPIIWPEGIKKTKQRDAVIKILEKAEAPVSALDIYAQIEKEGTSVWLSTIYRILELFCEKGVVLKTSVLDGEMAYYELSGDSHHHYAVCVDCHKIVPIAGCPMADFKPKLQGDFRVLGHRVEMYGYCRDCDKRNKASKGS
jgi:Fur family ferric uptake transcriptional regulator